MRSVLMKIIAASALAATSVAVVQPAQARDNTGVAVAAGIIGLGVGAAIASDHRGYDRGNYYYADYPGGYGGYYAPSYGYPAYGYSYGNGYYARGYDYDHHRDWRRDHWRDERGGWDHRDHWDRHDRRDDRGDDHWRR